jgi:hypothetical protein
MKMLNPYLKNHWYPQTMISKDAEEEIIRATAFLQIIVNLDNAINFYFWGNF